jgi:hypothetical protein
MGHPRRRRRGRPQPRLHRQNGIRTPIPPKPPPTPPTRGGHAGTRGTDERPSPNRPSSSPGSRHRAAPETTTSAQELRPGNSTFSQNTQRPASLPGLVPEHASRNTGFSFFFNPLPLFCPPSSQQTSILISALFIIPAPRLKPSMATRPFMYPNAMCPSNHSHPFPSPIEALK